MIINKAQPKLPPTLEALLEVARRDLEKFNLVLENYAKYNPVKNISKQEEFKKKLEVKQQRVKELEALIASRSDEAKEQELRQRQAFIEEEARREADIQARVEAARKEGFEQALKEQGKKEVDDKTK